MSIPLGSLRAILFDVSEPWVAELGRAVERAGVSVELVAVGRSEAEASLEGVDLVVLAGEALGARARRLVDERGGRALPVIVAQGELDPDARLALYRAGVDEIGGDAVELTGALLRARRTVLRERVTSRALEALEASFALLDAEGRPVVVAPDPAGVGPLGASDAEGGDEAEHATESPEADRERPIRRIHRSEGEGERAVARRALRTEGDGGLLLVHQDASALEELERRAFAAAKAESVAKLGRALMHDLNNVFCVISSFGELLLDSTPDDDPRREDVLEILRAGTRASSITQRLSAFSKSSPGRPTRVNVADLLRRAESLLRRVLGERLELAVTVASADATAVSDAVLLEQALVDLASCAREAVEPAGEGGLPARGHLTVAVEEDEREVRLRLSVGVESAGGEPTRPATFDASVARLSSILTLVERVGADLRFDVASPARVVLALPRALARVPGVAAPRARSHGADPETILLVEDEASVRVVTSRVLASLGYRVLDARLAADALSRADATPIDLLATDVVLPDADGRALYASLRAKNPALRALFLTGYADVELPELPAETGVLHKPFSNFELAKRVREALDGRSSRGQEGG